MSRSGSDFIPRTNPRTRKKLPAAPRAARVIIAAFFTLIL
jgi:hypothetical protein